MNIGNLSRNHLGDIEAENRLGGFVFEYSDPDIRGAVTLALNRINNTDFPKSAFTTDTCDQWILTLGVSYYLLKAKVNTKIRNSIDVESSRGNINRESNVALYLSVLAQMSSEFTRELSAYKRALNIEAGFNC